ncbi:MAG: hypothetical protein KF841_07310 [Phycisphaerae bacterium]|nr:hypothetical protein [Phycisphaerae bacterium]
MLSAFAVCIAIMQYARAAGREPTGSIGAYQPGKISGDVSKSGGPAASASRRGEAVQAIREGRYDTAESLIRAAMKSTQSTGVKDNWRIVESELEFARKRYTKSALISMRIVILTPESEQVGAALFRAARAYEKLGRPAKARELHRECIEHRTTSDAIRRKSEKRIEVLDAAGEKA